MSDPDDATRTEPSADNGPTTTGGGWLSPPRVFLVVAVPAAVVVAVLVFTTLVMPVQVTPQTTPQAQFEFSHDAGDGTVTVRHRGGDRFTTENTDRIEVRVDGEVRTSVSTFEPDDTVTVPGSPDETVRLVWIAPDDDSQILADYHVPDGGENT